MKFDIAEDGEGHEEHERGIEEDQTSLDDVTVVYRVSSTVRLYALLQLTE